MPYNEIRAIDESCKLYRPGHQLHWIQAKKAVEEQQPVIDVAIVVHDDGRVDIDGDDLNLTMWNHDPDRLRSARDHWGRAVWKPRYHVLSVPGLFGYIFNMAVLDERAPCKPGVLRQPRQSPHRARITAARYLPLHRSRPRSPGPGQALYHLQRQGQ